MAKGSYERSPVPFLTEERDREIWLDLVCAAAQGYCASQWSKDGKALNHSAPSVASAAACEVADILLAEYRYRVSRDRNGG